MDYLEQLNRLADDLEDGNYHRECQFIREMIESIMDRPPETVDELLYFIVNYNWW